MSELLDGVRAGRVESVPGLVEPLTAADRKEALAALKALRTELRGWPWGRWRERGQIQRALVVAGAGCHTGAAAAAAWLGARDLREGSRLPHVLLLDLLSEREPAWLGDVAHRLAGRASTAELDYPFISALVRLSGCPAPATDGYVHGWVDAAAPRDGLLAWLREDPQVRVMVPRLFGTAELPRPLAWYNDPAEPHHWPSVLTALAEEGVVERRLLVDSSVARLLRGGVPGDLVFFLNLLDRLALTPDEEREHISDWIAMASDGTSQVAGHAQGVLARLAVSGVLPARSLADMSRSVLFRSEKKLVRAQLVLLGKVLRADSGSAGELLPAVAEAFGHEDTGVQERALKLVARQLSAVESGLRSELAAAAALLSPVHRARATEVFGELPTEPDPGPYEEFLPPAPEPVRLEPAPATLAELVEEVSALVIAGGDMPSFERTLDGLVRHAHRDRTALADALRDALADRWWLDDTAAHHRDERFSRLTRGVEVVAASVLGKVSERMLSQANARGTASSSCAHSALNGVIDARLWEAAHLVRAKPLPFLLATPTWSTGALDPEVLVERLAEYQRLRATPAPVDFAQALLRVRRGRHPETARAAAALGTPEADRLAAWLIEEGTALPVLGRTGEPGAAGTSEPTEQSEQIERSEPSGAGRWWPRSRTKAQRLLAERRERLVVHREFPRAFQWLGRTEIRTRSHCYHWGGELTRSWPAVLPEDRDTLAAWLLPEVVGCAEHDQRAGAWWLPLLAESGGPAGLALHRALAYGLGARHPEDRLSAVDALLVLAARGELDGSLLGQELATLVDSGPVKLNRLADSARTAAATGAYGTVWSVLRAALPALLAPGAARAGTARPGLGEILSVAAECVERCGAAEEISGLPEVAGRGGTSRVTAQAARLLAALRSESDQSKPKLT
ncbi:DUF6493 family protein [Streptomyces sp. NPDC058200]|uniref:DUF7824 domain-containing protein n=1 Tax=Streptomyces sp. NPDC058200 TaxID=3346378 RepID=UPI0036EFC962